MKSGRISVGHPVDVAFGTVYSDQTDILVPGRMALHWQRRYDTGNISAATTSLGIGWTSKYFVSLKQIGQDFVFFTPEGNDEIFDDPNRRLALGMPLRNYGTFRELIRVGQSIFVVCWKQALGEIETFVFDPSSILGEWLLTRIENECGDSIEIIRDSSLRVWRICQTLEKRSLELTYSRLHDLERIDFVDAEGRVHPQMRYEHDQQHHLLAAFDAHGFADRYAYDSDSRLIREVARDGGVFHFQYDNDGRCVRTSGLGKYDEKTFRYLSGANTTAVTNSLGKTTHYQYLGTGQVTAVIDPTGATVTTTFDQQGRIVSLTNARGGTRKYTFDDRGDCVGVTDEMGGEYRFTFDDFHRPQLRIDPNGATWRHEYRPNGLVWRTTTPLGASWITEHDDQGNSISLTDPDGQTRRCHFGLRGDLREVVDFDGSITRFEFDSFGRVSRKIDPDGGITAVMFDALGNPITVLSPDGGRLMAEYDPGGNVAKLVDESGEITRFLYGPCGRLLERVDRRGQKVEYRWTTEPDLLECIINEKGESREFRYDDAGRLIRDKAFDGAVEIFRYNLEGDLEVIVDANGNEQRRTYDLAGRLLSISNTDGSSAFYTYDALGNISAAANGQSSTALLRDLTGTIIGESQGSNTIKSRLSLAGHHLGVESSTGLVLEHTVDPTGMPLATKVDGIEVLSFTRNFRGQPTSTSLYGRRILEQSYDSHGKLKQQRFHNWLDAKSEILRSYDFDSRGSVAACSEPGLGRTNYGYDRGERLVTVDSASNSARFERDPVGNAVSVETLTGGRSTERIEVQYAAGARLLRSGALEYEYDSKGRVVRRSVTLPDGTKLSLSFQWNALDELSSVQLPDGAVWRYIYDAFGRRIQKIGPDSQTDYVWDQNILLHELPQGSPPSTWLMDASDASPVGRVDRGGFQAILCDHLGRPREILNANGQLIGSIHFDPLGKTSGTSGTWSNVTPRFKGQLWDLETDLHYNRFRYYDPAIGRYISPDPIGLRGGLDQYSFGPNPINWFDPFGLETCYVVRDPPGTGDVIYVGITKQDPKDRQAQHRDIKGREGWVLEPVFTKDAKGRPLSHDTVKGIEQGLIDHYGLGKNGGQLENDINSMSCDNKKLGRRLKKGDPYVDAFLDKEGETRRKGTCPRR